MTRNNLRTVAVALLAGVTFAAGAVSPAAAANDPSKAKQDQQQPQKAENDRKYCIDTTTTASRITKRQCQTRAEWLADGVDPLKMMKQAR